VRAFLFYIDDWLSSKKIDLMDAGEERGYLRLLLRAATEPDCGLPNDDAQLAVFSKLGSQWFRPTKDKEFRLGEKTSGMKLRECFFEQNGRLYNERLLKEFNHQNEVREKRVQAGSRGGNSRANALANAQQTGKQKATNDVCVSVSSFKEERSKKEAALMNGALPHDPEGWMLRLYARHPKKKNKPLVEHMVLKLWESAEDPQGLFEHIDRVHAAKCADHDWQKSDGNFAPKLDEWLADDGYQVALRPKELELPRLT
jgi:uncharacterized protein YdaU (DUF1376 family)